MMRCLFLLSFIKYCASIPWIDQKRNDFVVDILNAREKKNTDLENNPNYTMTIRFFIFRVVHLLNHCHTPPPQLEKNPVLWWLHETQKALIFLFIYFCARRIRRYREQFESQNHWRKSEKLDSCYFTFWYTIIISQVLWLCCSSYFKRSISTCSVRQ